LQLIDNEVNHEAKGNSGLEVEVTVVEICVSLVYDLQNVVINSTIAHRATCCSVCETDCSDSNENSLSVSSGRFFFFRQNILNKALRIKITFKTVGGDIVQILECNYHL
jgi:hypothetical protein